MNSSAASIIARLVTETLQLASTPESRADWPIFISLMPAAQASRVPRNSVAVYDTTGTKDGRHLRTGEVIEHPGIQLKVRSESYAIGWAKIEALKVALDLIFRSTVEMEDGTSYLVQNLSRTSGILPLGQEEGTADFLFTLNYTVTVKAI